MNDYNKILKEKLKKQVETYEGVESLVDTENNLISKFDLRKIQTLLVSFSNELNKAISGFAKSNDDNMLLFNINGVELAYNNFVMFLEQIQFRLKATFEKQKVYNAIELEIMPTLVKFKQILDADNDVSPNEKSSINTIINNFTNRQYNVLGAYTNLTIDKTVQNMNRVKNDKKKDSERKVQENILDTLGKIQIDNMRNIRERGRDWERIDPIDPRWARAAEPQDDFNPPQTEGELNLDTLEQSEPIAEEEKAQEPITEAPKKRIIMVKPSKFHPKQPKN